MMALNSALKLQGTDTAMRACSALIAALLDTIALKGMTSMCVAVVIGGTTRKMM